MTTLADYKRSEPLSLDELLTTIAQEEAEAIQETGPMEICAKCIYRRRPCCRDETPVERLSCPVVGAILGGDGDGVTCLKNSPRSPQSV